VIPITYWPIGVQRRTNGQLTTAIARFALGASCVKPAVTQTYNYIQVACFNIYYQV